MGIVLILLWYIIGIATFLITCLRIGEIEGMDVAMSFIAGIIGPLNLLFLILYWKG